jgi:hypothetical protein
VRHEISRRYKITGQITVLYILILIFLNSKREDKRLLPE